MKKTYTLLFCILLVLSASLSLYAAPVTPSQAMDIAKKIFAAQPATKAGTVTLKLVWDGEDVATKAAQPAFYVIARDGGGFVIVAGDDNVTPILAISDRNEFKVEDMPENVKWWMDRMKAYVRASVQTPGVKQQWVGLMGTKSGPIAGEVTNKVEHLTPEWGQGGVYLGKNIYNSKCPIVTATVKENDTQVQKQVHAVTGCVATAIGEVMTTLSGLSLYASVMPANGSGTVQPYTVSEGFVSAVTPYILGATYDWANLRTLKDTAAIKRAVERGGEADLAMIENMNQLLADLGAVMHAYYSAYNTTAYTQRAADTMAKYYGFNKAAYFDEAANYSAHQWREKLKGQLAARPIVYSGRTQPDSLGNTYGHAFVFDGYGTYRGADVFHVNFGWDGICNGYYYETNLDSDGTPEYNYSWQCGAVFDFYPDPHSTYPILLEAHYTDATFCGVKAGPIAQNPEQFDISYNICNNGKTTYNGKIKIAVRKKNGEVHDIVSSRDFSVEPNRYSGASSGPYSITDISFGDQVVCFYKEDLIKEDSDASAWKLLPGPIATAISAWPLTPAAFIKTESSYSLNDWFVFELMNNNYIYPKTTWTITDPDGQTTTYQQSDKEFQLTKTGKYKIQAATAQTAGTVIENLVTIINVGNGNSQ